MSWWDYGYQVRISKNYVILAFRSAIGTSSFSTLPQITAMANRTILVDNNTWNNTHISQVGQAMSRTEERSYEIMRELDVDYVLVIFGGLTGYSSDGKPD